MMKKIVTILFVALLGLTQTYSQDIVITEFSQGASGGKEWVEFVVNTNNFDMQNFSLRDGNGSLNISFSGAGFASIPAGTRIVVYNGGDVDATIPGPDLDISDGVLIISSLNNSGTFGLTRTSGWSNTTGAFANGTTTDYARIYDDSIPTPNVITADLSTHYPGANQVMQFDGTDYYINPSASASPGTSGVLPIELADFTAQASNGDVTLNWQTISEINSDVFEVQHLAGGEWVTVATVQAAGASTDVRSYTQAVKGLQVGTHYFRLKSVDKDGGVKYSKQIAVAVEVPGTFVMNPAYPNPFNPQTTLTFAVAKKQAVTMTLFNALGQQISVLYQGSPEANTLQTVQLNGSTLQSGAYFVRLTGENFSGMQKVMLVK